LKFLARLREASFCVYSLLHCVGELMSETRCETRTITPLAIY